MFWNVAENGPCDCVVCDRLTVVFEIISHFPQEPQLRKNHYDGKRIVRGWKIHCTVQRDFCDVAGVAKGDAEQHRECCFRSRRNQ